MRSLRFLTDYFRLIICLLYPIVEFIVGIVQILTELKSSMGFAPNAEITLEMDPGTFDMKKLSQLSEAGISRLSLGVQSFDSKILESAGRAHTVDDVTKALELVRSSNFRDNFSIDLISSLPGLSIDLWQDTLEKASASGCSHVSVYDLQVEDKTAFGRWYSPGVFPLPSDEISANMFCRATEVLKASGFEHYEVSNYARQGKRSQHNQRYWNCKPTWGFGMGAASFIANNRYTRPDRMIEYTKWVTELELMGFTGSTTNIDDDFEDASLSLDENNPGDKSTDLILFDGIVNPTGATDILEVVMLALRTSDGLNLTELGNLYGEISVEKVLKAVLPFQERGLVEMKDTTVDVTSNNAETDLQSTNLLSRIVCLTDPEGFLLSNDIISSVFVELTC